MLLIAPRPLIDLTFPPHTARASKYSTVLYMCVPDHAVKTKVAFTKYLCSQVQVQGNLGTVSKKQDRQLTQTNDVPNLVSVSPSLATQRASHTCHSSMSSQVNNNKSFSLHQQKSNIKKQKVLSVSLACFHGRAQISSLNDIPGSSLSSILRHASYSAKRFWAYPA